MDRICHITNIHDWNDTRIFYKECCSLADAGYQVSLVAPDAEEGIHNGVSVLSVARKSKSRIYRASFLAWAVMRKALTTKAKIIHFHDPELIWIGFILRLFYRKTIIFDVHENLTAQIQDKQWLKFKRLIAWLYGRMERFASRYFHIVIAEESYRYLFEKQAKSLTPVFNFPEVEKLQQFSQDTRSDQNGILYVGVVSEIRGIMQIIQALGILKRKNIPFTFHCVGPIEDGIISKLKALDEYNDVKENIIFYGRKPLFEAYQLAGQSKMALSLLHPTPNYIRSYSTKIFEYMAIGLPFVVSDFPLYSFVTERKIGACVNPFDTHGIAKVFEYLLSDDPEIARQIDRARHAVKNDFSWESQREKLLGLYASITK
ncbi:glycosyltransferase [Crocinitomicaceae bacterium CZZ-1]|uniref:Glycosyltransferase n=1 Tax=Taishania pollutisoli TaxID=2766479 RepID=A0A8J6PB81_9FLAO|nr:glycosyltransferase [Taishania pollutisoli]MBC9811953.1 glycosyltransferase [Taishania pollutisoli]